MEISKIPYTAATAPTQFVTSVHQIGFAVLVDPPFCPALLAETYAEWSAFFASPLKHRYTFDPQVQAGYFPLQMETAKGYSQPDLKEFFHLYEWSALPAGMSDRTRRLFQTLLHLATELLGWLETYAPAAIQRQLTMPLGRMIAGSRATLLRPIHYPPLPEILPGGAVRAAAHEDINLITLLPAATAGGLEIQDNQGNWHAVPSDRGDLIVNAGDMLQLATGGYYRSTTHRVVNPQGAAAQTCRYALPLFLHPRPEVVLAGTITARSYLQERLQAIGLLSRS